MADVQQWDQFKHLTVANLRTPLGRRAFIGGMADIYLINYESIHTLVKLVEKRGDTLPYQMIVYDESTKCKNPASKRVNLLRKSLLSPPRRIGLTGTPAPNSLLDLFAQVRLLDDGQRLGRSFDHFKRTYFAATDYQQYNWEPIPGAAERIDERIADITLTLRTSDWVKDLPDCYVNDVEVKLPPAVMAQYEEFKKELILELRREVQITAANAAVLVRKLLQFTSGAIYDGEKKAHEVHDYKTEALAKLVKETKGPVLVLCDFKHEQDRIRRKFPQARFFADARTPMLQMQLITQWNRREIPILVGHPMSMGHGLNLQQGSKTMVWMSLTYSRESYEQTIARLHRRGQKEVVTVHRLMVPSTVDDVVAEVLEEKRNTEQRLLTALMLLEGDGKRRTPLKFAPEPETEFDEEAFWG
jgi:SNF2 family DNA or RNA helicase